MIAAATSLPQALVGVPVFVAALALGLRVIWRQAARHDLLTPVLVALLVRLTVMVGAHVASVLGGGGGFYFHDDPRYDDVARAISGAWLDGQIVDPGSHEYAGSLAFGYPLLVAVVYTLIGPVALGAKLVNVLLGTATVLLCGLLARRLLGERATTVATWLAALLPTLVWWSAPLLKEPLVTLLFTGGLLAALSLPRRTAMLAVGGALAGLVLTRIQAAAVLAGTIALTGLIYAGRGQRRRALATIAAGAVVLVGLALVLSGDGPPQVVAALRDNGAQMIDTYGAGSVPYDVGRSLLGPFPWVFDANTESWQLALYPGVWVLYALYPTVLVGLWRLRTHPFVLAYIVLPAAAFVIINSVFAGLAHRQRVTIEPLLILLAVAGADTWRAVARRGAVAIAVVAPVALVHTRSVLTAAAIALAAAGAWRLAGRLPAEPNDYIAGVGDTRPLVLAASRPS